MQPTLNALTDMGLSLAVYEEFGEASGLTTSSTTIDSDGDYSEPITSTKTHDIEDSTINSNRISSSTDSRNNGLIPGIGDDNLPTQPTPGISSGDKTVNNETKKKSTKTVKRKGKERGLSQIVSPGARTYLYGLSLKDGDIEVILLLYSQKL